MQSVGHIRSGHCLTPRICCFHVCCFAASRQAALSHSTTAGADMVALSQLYARQW